MVLGWGWRSWMECDLHLPSVLTPPKGSYSSRILAAAADGLHTHLEQHLCVCSPPPSLKAPWIRSGRGILESRCHSKACFLLPRAPPSAQTTPVGASPCSLSLHPHFSASPSLNCKQDRTFCCVSFQYSSFPWRSSLSPQQVIPSLGP